MNEALNASKSAFATKSEVASSTGTPFEPDLLGALKTHLGPPSQARCQLQSSFLESLHIGVTSMVAPEASLRTIASPSLKGSSEIPLSIDVSGNTNTSTPLGAIVPSIPRALFLPCMVSIVHPSTH